LFNRKGPQQTSKRHRRHVRLRHNHGVASAAKQIPAAML
jgi:hypothetical protein